MSDQPQYDIKRDWTEERPPLPGSRDELEEEMKLVTRITSTKEFVKAAQSSDYVDRWIRENLGRPFVEKGASDEDALQAGVKRLMQIHASSPAATAEITAEAAGERARQEREISTARIEAILAEVGLRGKIAGIDEKIKLQELQLLQFSMENERKKIEEGDSIGMGLSDAQKIITALAPKDPREMKKAIALDPLLKLATLAWMQGYQIHYGGTITHEDVHEGVFGWKFLGTVPIYTPPGEAGAAPLERTPEQQEILRRLGITQE